jgi:cardiolipin synthase
MYIKDWKKEVFTIPNLLSLFRLVLIPVYVHIYLNAKVEQDYLLAGIILAVSCLTDAVDGKLARHLNQISNLGKLLDPVADKFTQLAITICLSTRYPVLLKVLVLFLIKEFFQLFAMVMNLCKGKMLDGALMAGKVCTTVLFTSLILMVLMPNLEVMWVDIIATVDCVFLAVAFLQYIRAYFGKHAKVQDIET